MIFRCVRSRPCWRRFFFDICWVIGVFGMIAHLPAFSQKANIVFIFADDLGFRDLPSHGARQNTMPNLDQLAAQGMSFSNFTVPNAVCSPSRASFLSGKNPHKTGINSALTRGSRRGIAEEELTIAELLKGQGYATYLVGKWHVGHREIHRPNRHGFDNFFGILMSHDQTRDLYRNDDLIEQRTDLGNLTTRFTSTASDWIREHRDSSQPFFLYFAHVSPHVPLEVSDKVSELEIGSSYSRSLFELDWSVGKIIESLELNGLLSNTLIVFSSDNGPWSSKGEEGGAVAPLRGGKRTDHEGGVRIPAIFYWKGRVAPSSINHSLASITDLYATFAELAGEESAKEILEDSESLLNQISAPNNFVGPREEVYFFSERFLTAVRWENYKLHINAGVWKLYDLSLIHI